MNKAEQELEKLKYLISECHSNIRMHQNQIAALEGEANGIRLAIERLEPFIPKEPLS